MNDVEEYKDLKNRAMAILSLIDNQPLRKNVTQVSDLDFEFEFIA